MKAAFGGMLPGLSNAIIFSVWFLSLFHFAVAWVDSATAIFYFLFGSYGQPPTLSIGAVESSILGCSRISVPLGRGVSTIKRNQDLFCRLPPLRDIFCHQFCQYEFQFWTAFYQVKPVPLH